MKVVINKCYGSFRIPAGFCSLYPKLNLNTYDYISRTDTRLIDYLIKNPDINDYRSNTAVSTKLKIVDVPDNATDWDILEHDGMEQVVAVINGKIRYIF